MVVLSKACKTFPFKQTITYASKSLICMIQCRECKNIPDTPAKYIHWLPRTQTSLFKTCAQRKAGRRQRATTGNNVSLCTYRKNSHKASSRFFFYLHFFIVRLPHWVLDLSLNAQPGVNKFYLLFIYIPHFMMKLCRMCSKYLLSVLFFICFCDITQ